MVIGQKLPVISFNGGGIVGYDEKLNIHYDKKSKYGNTTVYVVAPQITEEEKQRRIKQLESVIESIIKYEVEITIEK